MKEYRQDPGGRRIKGDDLKIIQEIALLSEKFLSGYGNFIVYGCESGNNSITSGIVMLDGKACTFAGAPQATFPFYIKKIQSTENVAYESGAGTGIGYETYEAVKSSAEEAGAFRLDTAARFTDVFKPKNAAHADTATNATNSANAANAAHANTATNATTSTNAGNADTVDGQHFSWTNTSNSPTYLWASNANGQAFLADRSKLSVQNADTLGGLQLSQLTQRVEDIPLNANLNNYRTPGFYRASTTTIAGTITNRPAGMNVAFGMLVIGTGQWAQLLFPISTNATDTPDAYYRSVSYDGTSASAWRKIADGGNAASLQSVNLSGLVQQPISIPENSDLNNYTTPGFYYCPANVTANTISNKPYNSTAFSLLIEKHAGVRQTFSLYPTGDVRTWVRNYYNGTWGTWYQLTDSKGSAVSISGYTINDLKQTQISVLPNGDFYSPSYWHNLKNGTYFKTTGTFTNSPIAGSALVEVIGYGTEKRITMYSQVSYDIWQMGVNHSVYVPWYRMISTNDGAVDTTGSVANSLVKRSGTQINAAGGFYQQSDERLKDIHEDFNLNLNDIITLPLFYYTLKNNPTKRELGTSAQKLMAKFPELVSQGEDGYYSVAYDKLAVLALKGISLLTNELAAVKEELLAIKQTVSEIINSIKTDCSNDVGSLNQSIN